jgi:hypothetical protein
MGHPRSPGPESARSTSTRAASRTGKRTGRGASASAWPPVRRGKTPGACSPGRTGHRFPLTGCHADSRNWPARQGCQSSSSTLPGTPQRRWRWRPASTSRSFPTSSATPRPGLLRTRTSMCADRFTRMPRRRSWPSCPTTRRHGRRDHDRVRPFCVRPGLRETGQPGPPQVSRWSPGWSERRTWDSNPRWMSPPIAVFKTAAIGH